MKEPHACETQLTRLRQLHQAVGQPCDPAQLLRGCLKLFLGIAVSELGLTQALHDDPDRCQRCADLLSDAGRQLAQRHQLLRLYRLSLDLPPLRQIAHDRRAGEAVRRAVPRHRARQAHLHLAPILPEPARLVVPHRAQLTQGFAQSLRLPRLDQVRRDQPRHRLADDLVRRVAEHLLGSTIPGDDVLLVVYGPDRVRRVCHQLGPPGLWARRRHAVDRRHASRAGCHAHIAEDPADPHGRQGSRIHPSRRWAQQRQEALVQVGAQHIRDGLAFYVRCRQSEGRLAGAVQIDHATLPIHEEDWIRQAVQNRQLQRYHAPSVLQSGITLGSHEHSVPHAGDIDSGRADGHKALAWRRLQ